MKRLLLASLALLSMAGCEVVCETNCRDNYERCLGPAPSDPGDYCIGQYERCLDACSPAAQGAVDQALPSGSNVVYSR